MIYRAYAYDKPVTELQRKVAVQVNGARWLIHIDTVQTTDNAEPELQYFAGFDGENIYCVAGPTNPVPAQTLPDATLPRPLASIFLNQLLPTPPTLGAAFVWFTFAPDAKSQTISGDGGRCIWDDSLLRKHKIVLPIDLWTNTEDGAMTVVVAWQNDGKIRGEDDHQNLRMGSWPEPFDKGYTNAIFTVTYTNINGMNIPLMASLTSYVPDYPAKNKFAAVLPQESYVLKLTVVVPQCEVADFHPSLPPMTLVTDQRLMDSHPDYRPFKIATNGGAWSAIPLENLLSNYSRYAAMRKNFTPMPASDTQEHIHRARRQIIVGCMVLVSALVLVLASRRARRT